MVEQDWYSSVVPLAIRLRSYLLGRIGTWFIDKRDFLREFPDEDPEEVEHAIDILRTNAAIFPVSGTDTYRINWKRLSSVGL